MKPKYSFRSGSRLKDADAVGAGKELTRISKQPGGITAESVVETAEAKDNPLHDFFEWSNTKAARQYRLEQARHLIRSVVIEYEPVKEAGPIRAFIAFETPPESLDDDGRYVTVQRILSDAELREQLVEEALREHHRWEDRYKHLKELSDIIVAREKVEAAIRGRKKKKGS